MIVKGAVRRLARRLAYTGRASGPPAKRRWLKLFERITRPRITAARQAEQELWDGLLGESVWKCDEARRTTQLAGWRLHYQLEQPADHARRAYETMSGLDAESTPSEPETEREAGQ